MPTDQSSAEKERLLDTIRNLEAGSEPPEPMLKWFKYSHLPPELAKNSRPFCELAELIATQYPRNAERTVALRKLLEAKDAAVRACIP